MSFAKIRRREIRFEKKGKKRNANKVAKEFANLRSKVGRKGATHGDKCNPVNG